MADRHSTSKHLPPRSSLRRSSMNSNVFSDDYALEEYEVPDGRLPPATDRDGNTTTTPSPQRSLSVQQALESPSGSVRRSMLSQRSVGQESTASRLVERESVASRRSVSDLSRTASAPHRSVQTISTYGLPRAQSPYQGPTGPSQPYGQYSQGIPLSRTASVATTTTIRPPERSYSGPGRPTQPYGMFAQNTVPEDDQDVAGMAPAMPGFPGIAATQNYQRRLGPDREDADDIIGPDGYTEQLPPYSRYANGIPPKYDSAAANLPDHPPPHSQPEGSQPSQAAIQRRTAEYPGEYYRPEESMGPVVPVDPFADSTAQLSSTTAENSLQGSGLAKDEKGKFRKRVKEKGNKRVCCGLLPCWALAFVVVVIGAAIVLGGVIGGVVAGHHFQKNYPHPGPSAQPASSNDSIATITTTTLADATPVPTPGNLPALPTGVSNVLLSNATANTNACLSDGQKSAWDCSTGAELTIDVELHNPRMPTVSLTYPQPADTQIRYGAQPPQLPNTANLVLMKDRDELNLGAAYFFQQIYNKTVIVREQDLPGGYQNAKRSESWDAANWLEARESDWYAAEMASPTDKPWYCFWNGTILEGFIYVYQDVNTTSTTSSVAAGPTSSAPSKRQAPAPSGSPYPKVVKIEERRPLRNSPQPYCQQMQILNSYAPGPLVQNGQPVQIQLIETEPAPLPYSQQQFNPNGGGGGRGGGGPPPPSGFKRRRQAGPDSNCMCEWQNK